MASGKATIEISAKNSKLKSKLKESKSHIKSFGRAIQTALGVSLAGAISRVMDFAKQTISFVVKMTSKFEDLNVQFSVLIKNQSLASRVMKDLRDFSVKTPFTPEEVFRASKALLAFGVAAKDQIKVIKMMGDISAVSGKDLEELAFIYGKVFGRGKAQMRELNQFMRGGVGIIDELGKVTGKTGDEIFKMSERGEITFKLVAKALESMTVKGGRFYQGAARKASTLSGRWSTLKGVVMDLADSFGQLFSGQLLDSMNWMISKLEKLSKIMKQVNVDIKGTATEFSVMERVMLFLSSTGIKEYKDLLANQDRFNQDLKKAAELAAKYAADNEKRNGIKDGSGASEASLAASKALRDSRAAAGLFTVGRPMVDVQGMQLAELKKINVNLEKEFGTYEEFMKELKTRITPRPAVLYGIGPETGMRGGAM